ncbi:hypothetical protein JTB14_011738 [Gonioctena quinquepunctata]|nr:hypothetical protein JTB14_011738 [Gonioctena quinquepunctata]
MININPCDKDYQRIVFRSAPDEPLKDFVLKTVVYGSSPSPYLALACLRQLADDEGNNFPLAAEVIRSASYIDDFVCGSSTLENTRNLRTELISLLKKAGFEKRKWSSNNSTLISDLPPSHLSTNPLSFDSDSSSSLKVLGMQWNPVQDTFSFTVKPFQNNHFIRSSSDVCDPLGFLSPITFLAKYLIQCLWTSGIGWDDTPSPDIIRTWNQYKDELPSLSNISLPRKLYAFHAQRYGIHGFCDAWLYFCDLFTDNFIL